MKGKKKVKWYKFQDESLEEDTPVWSIGKDDMNLIEIPFSKLDKRASKSGGVVVRKDYTSKDKKTGEVRNCYMEIRGDPKFGLPTPFEEEIYIAAMEITNRYGFEDIIVPATKYELLKIMNKPIDGHYREMLERGFDRLVGVRIKTNDFWDNENKGYMTLNFGIMSDYGFYEDERRGRRRGYGEKGLPPKGFFAWDIVLAGNSFMRDFIKSLDTETYFSLKLPVSKRLYRYGDKHIKKGSHSIDLFKLAFVRLGMSENRYQSLVIERLRPGIEELSERNLMRILLQESKTTSGYKVVFLPAGKKQISVLREIGDSGKREASVSQDGEKSPLIEELKGFGVTGKTALSWVKRYGEERIKEAVESLRFNLEGGGEIKNSGGWLRRHLEEGWEQPSGVKQRKKQRENERKLREEKERNKRQEEMKKEYENWKEKRRDAYLSGLTTAERSGLEAEALRITKEKHRLFLKGNSDQEVKGRVYYEVELNRIIDERGDIPDFEEWLKQKGY
jgi:hypothetical protein